MVLESRNNSTLRSVEIITFTTNCKFRFQGPKLWPAGRQCDWKLSLGDQNFQSSQLATYHEVFKPCVKKFHALFQLKNERTIPIKLLTQYLSSWQFSQSTTLCRHTWSTYLSPRCCGRIAQTCFSVFAKWISRASESEAVNLATLKKDNLGTTLIPVHAERNWCYVQSSNLDTCLFKANALKGFSASLSRFSGLSRVGNSNVSVKHCLEIKLITLFRYMIWGKTFLWTPLSDHLFASSDWKKATWRLHQKVNFRPWVRCMAV